MKLKVEDFNRYLNKKFMYRPEDLTTSFHSRLIQIKMDNKEIKVELDIEGVGMCWVRASESMLKDMRRSNP